MHWAQQNGNSSADGKTNLKDRLGAGVVPSQCWNEWKQHLVAITRSYPPSISKLKIGSGTRKCWPLLLHQNRIRKEKKKKSTATTLHTWYDSTYVFIFFKNQAKFGIKQVFHLMTALMSVQPVWCKHAYATHWRGETSNKNITHRLPGQVATTTREGRAARFPTGQ